MTDQHVEGNKYGYAANSAETNLSGSSYTNKRPNFDEFKKIFDNKSEFELLEYKILTNNSTDVKTDLTERNRKMPLFNLRNDAGFIFVKFPSRNEYRVTYFDNNKIVLMRRDNKAVYNFVLKK